MNLRTLSLFALAAGAALPLAAQFDVPQPTPPNADRPLTVNNDTPLASLDYQLTTGVFDQRGAFATAYDETDRLVEAQVARLRAAGLVFTPKASGGLDDARDEARQAFRDLSLTTEETWVTARQNAVQALRKIESALVSLEKTATRPQG